MTSVRRLDRAGLARDNGCLAQRIQPWPELQAPFEGSWCELDPGESSGAHAHHEHELWVVVRGSATVTSEGTPHVLCEGDMIFLEPGEEHTATNDASDRFVMLSIWWDKDMSTAFRDSTKAAGHG